MALRPLYMGLHFYLPASSGTSHGAAVAHARYMVNPKKEELVRSDPSIHARYMVERPGSAGLFGPDPEQEPELSRVVATIREHPGPVWRLIVSVTEADARMLAEQGPASLLHRSGWETACRAVMPQLAEELGLSTVDWAAAMHRKEGHPHIHLLLWEPTAQRRQGRVSAGERRAMRSLWIRELYRPIRAPLQAEKHQVRESLRDAARQLGPGVSPALTLTPMARRELAARLLSIAQHLPSHGRLAIAYLPRPVRDEVRETASWVLREIPEFQVLAERYQELAAEMARHQSDGITWHQEARVNAWRDLVDRVSPVLMRVAVGWDREQGRAIRRQLASGGLAEESPGTRQLLQTALHRMLHQGSTQRRATARDLVQALYERTGSTLSERERLRMEAFLVDWAARARGEMADLAADVAQGLWRGLMDEMAEWEQVARFIDADRVRRREREERMRG